MLWQLFRFSVTEITTICLPVTGNLFRTTVIALIYSNRVVVIFINRNKMHGKFLVTSYEPPSHNRLTYTNEKLGVFSEKKIDWCIMYKSEIRERATKLSTFSLYRDRLEKADRPERKLGRGMTEHKREWAKWHWSDCWEEITILVSQG